jgi:hypothetical protein
MAAAVADTLAEHEAFWSVRGPLTEAQERWCAFELELRRNMAANGETPAEWLIAEIRSGRWEARQRQNRENMIHHLARLARLRREGYSFDAEHRLVAPSRPRNWRDGSRERRPAGRRARVTRRARAPAREPDDPEPEPLVAIPPARFWADVAAWQAST